VKIKKILCCFLIGTLLFTSCSSTTTVSSESNMTNESENIISQIQTDSNSNSTDEYKKLYQKYYQQSNEKNLELIYASSTDSTFSQNLNIPVVKEINSFSYNGLPCIVEKKHNAEDGTIYEYIVTITKEKSIQQYIYLFDGDSITYCTVGNLSYFTTEKQNDDLKYAEIREYVQEHDKNETFLMIKTGTICVPIEVKNIFTLSQMETFFSEGIGELPNDEIIFKASMQEMVGGIKTIQNIQKSQNLYKEYQKQIDESLDNYSKAYEESYYKEKKFSLGSEEDVDYTKTEEGFFEGFYFSKITNNNNTTSNYITNFSGAGAEQFLNYLKISDSVTFLQTFTIGYADRAWAISKQKLISSYNVENTIIDSNQGISSLIPELRLVIYTESDPENLFKSIENDYNSYTNIVE